MCSRPHVQGEAAPLRVRHSARKLTDGGGLILVRRLWDDLGLGSWIDRGTEGLAGFFRPSLMVEVWVVLLLYGGRVLDDLPLLDRRGIRRLFGWTRLPDPTTFGRWLRRAGEPLVPLLDELLWQVVCRRWRLRGVPRTLTLILDSTVSVRYGLKQAGAVRGYNPMWTPPWVANLTSNRGRWHSGQVRSYVRPLDAALSAAGPYGVREIGSKSHNRARWPLGCNWFFRSRLVDRLPLPCPTSCLHSLQLEPQWPVSIRPSRTIPSVFSAFPA